MSEVVHLRAGKAEARRIIRAFVGMLSGKNGIQSSDARGVFYAIGFAALSDISDDFIRKARGGVGEDGNQWPRLSPKTLAYSRRFGPGEQAALKRAAGLGPGNRHAPGKNKGLLTAAELKRWRAIYSQLLRAWAGRKPLGEAKAIAAATAWKRLKAQGAKTKLEVYGNRPHEPLRDTGILFNSLSVGTMMGPNEYIKPQRDGGELQVFESLANGVVVGTKVPYAKTHNEGNPAKGIPERRFIPRPGQVPRVWLERWLKAGVSAIEAALRIRMLRGY